MLSYLVRRAIPLACLALLWSTHVLAAPLRVEPCDPASSCPPVILVHGRNAPPSVWGSMMSALIGQGYPASHLFAWDYDSSASSNETLSPQLAAYVQQVLLQTGAGQVDIVAHSLGGLPTRWYITFGGGHAYVRQWISLAGPNHGTDLAWACALWDQGCRDMTPPSYVLTHLNGGNPEVGPPVHFWTIWSSCDEQILPPTSTILSGADENYKTAACLKHNDQLNSVEVANKVITILTGTTAPL